MKVRSTYYVDQSVLLSRISGCKLQMRTKVKVACSVVLGSRISSTFAELKGHEHVAKAVTAGITCNTLLY